MPLAPTTKKTFFFVVSSILFSSLYVSIFLDLTIKILFQVSLSLFYGLLIRWVLDEKERLLGEFCFNMKIVRISLCFWSLGYQRWKKSNHYCCDFIFWLLKKFAISLVDFCNRIVTRFWWIIVKINLEEQFTSEI